MPQSLLQPILNRCYLDARFLSDLWRDPPPQDSCGLPFREHH